MRGGLLHLWRQGRASRLVRTRVDVRSMSGGAVGSFTMMNVTAGIDGPLHWGSLGLSSSQCLKGGSGGFSPVWVSHLISTKGFGFF